MMVVVMMMIMVVMVIDLYHFELRDQDNKYIVLSIIWLHVVALWSGNKNASICWCRMIWEKDDWWGWDCMYILKESLKNQLRVFATTKMNCFCATYSFSTLSLILQLAFIYMFPFLFSDEISDGVDPWISDWVPAAGRTATTSWSFLRSWSCTDDLFFADPPVFRFDTRGWR